MKKYTETHEWVEFCNATEQKKARVGITKYAASEIGGIVFVELPKAGQTLAINEVAAICESHKAAIEILSPLSGKVVSINASLQRDIQKINNSPEDLGFLYEIEVSNIKEYDLLLDQQTYEKLIAKN